MSNKSSSASSFFFFSISSLCFYKISTCLTDLCRSDKSCILLSISLSSASSSYYSLSGTKSSSSLQLSLNLKKCSFQTLSFQYSQSFILVIRLGSPSRIKLAFLNAVSLCISMTAQIFRVLSLTFIWSLSNSQLKRKLPYLQLCTSSARNVNSLSLNSNQLLILCQI